MTIDEKVQAMSDADLAATWEALRNYNPREMYDAEQGITMDDWAQTVYSEVIRRDVPSPIILDEYCWMHTPGGWKCGVCYRLLALNDQKAQEDGQAAEFYNIMAEAQ